MIVSSRDSAKGITVQLFIILRSGLEKALRIPDSLPKDFIVPLIDIFILNLLVCVSSLVMISSPEVW